MSTINQLRKYIQTLPTGKPFLSSSLRHLAPANNLRKILERMVKTGNLKRVTRGMFVKPKQIPYIQESMPSANEIAQTIAQATGETITIHGAEAVRKFHLSTQTPMQPIFYTSGNTRNLKVGNQNILLKHMSPRKMVAAGTKVGDVILALWYLGKQNVTLNIIQNIKSQLTVNEFEGLLKEVIHMPAWMAELFYYYQQKQANDVR